MKHFTQKEVEEEEKGISRGVVGQKLGISRIGVSTSLRKLKLYKWRRTKDKSVGDEQFLTVMPYVNRKKKSCKGLKQGLRAASGPSLTLLFTEATLERVSVDT